MLAFEIVVLVVVGRFCIALFSALEQTHCALVACGSEWVTVVFSSSFIFNFLYTARFFNIHSSSVLTALFGCCMAGAT